MDQCLHLTVVYHGVVGTKNEQIQRFTDVYTESCIAFEWIEPADLVTQFTYN